MRTFLPAFLLCLLLPSLALSKSHVQSANGLRRRHPHLNSQRAGVPRAKINDRQVASTFVTSSYKLPLTRVTARNSNIHPQILLQQHINRSVKRHARMTRRAPPSREELATRLRKRVLAIEESQQHQIKKRWRGGKAMSGLSDLSAAISSMFNPATRKGKGQGNRNGNDETAGNDRDGASNSASSTATTNDGNSTVSASGDGAAAAGTGFPAAKAAAAASNTVTKATGTLADNSLGLDIEANEVGYLASFQLGSEGQSFLLLCDSGSADTWVPSDKCTQCGDHQALGTSNSKTFVDTGKAFQVTYGTGNVAGTIVNDTMVIAGLKLVGNAFGVTTVESQDFSAADVPFDGLVGLAQSSLSDQQVPTPIESLASAGLVKDAQVGYFLGTVDSAKQDGEITFGGVDPTRFSGELTELPNVSSVGFWEAEVDTVSVNGADLQLKGRTAILDTGTTLMIMPQADANAVHAAIDGAKADGQGGFTVPCTTTAEVSLTFGGQTFTIKPSDLTFLPVDAEDPTGDCVSGIAAGNIGAATQWLVGDTFLKNRYFATDVTTNTLALANPASSA